MSRRKQNVLVRVGIWALGVVGAFLLVLGAGSAVRHVSGWVSPPPPPLAQQIDSIVRDAAQHGLTLQSQAAARLHPGGDLSYIFVFRPSKYGKYGQAPSSVLRIYDVRHKSLRLAYRLRPVFNDPKVPRPFRSSGINVLSVADLYGNRTDEIVAALALYAVDSVPTFPVVVRWQAETDRYTAEPIMSGESRPDLHGDRDWTQGYREAASILNSADPREHFTSGHAEAVHVELGARPVLLATFYAFARSRAEPTKFEVNVWSLRTHNRCYSSRPLFVAPVGYQNYDVSMSQVWRKIQSRVSCF